MTTKVTSSVLANTGVVADTYGSASLVPIITIDAQGRITSATAATVSGAGAGVGATTYTQTKFTATAGQTVFSVNYTVGYVQVFLNGVLLDSLTEFTASNGTSITLSQAAALNDIITVYAYSVNTIANIAGGAAGTVIYQSAANTTSNTDVGTTGHLLTSAGAGKPYWTAQTALSIANTQITGLITTPQVADSAITAPKIAPGVIPSGGLSGQIFSANTAGPGAWTAPPTTTRIKVTVVGGGGGSSGILGGAASPVSRTGAGGGTAIRSIPVTGGTPYPYTIGAGGTAGPGPGGAPAGTGGTTSFGSPAQVSATGGAGGTACVSIVSGGGGITGDINIRGGSGGAITVGSSGPNPASPGCPVSVTGYISIGGGCTLLARRNYSPGTGFAFGGGAGGCGPSAGGAGGIIIEF